MTDLVERINDLILKHRRLYGNNDGIITLGSGSSELSLLREASQEIQRLRDDLEEAGEGDTWENACKRLEKEVADARTAARWLHNNLDHADDVDIEGAAERKWPWLNESVQETAEILADAPFMEELEESIEQMKRGETVDWEEVKFRVVKEED